MRSAFGLLVCLAFWFGPAVPAPAGQAASDAELREIAEEAYVYAFPLVLMRKTLDAGTNVAREGERSAPLNQFARMRSFPDADFTLVVRPNVDTLYASLFYDVSVEPLVIEAPASPRYCLFPCLDLWSNVFTSPGDRTTGSGALAFALVGPRWRGVLPPGVREYRSPTSQGWIIGRIQANGAPDYGVVHAFQDRLKAYPLSAHGKPYLPPENEVDPAIDMETPPIAQVEKMGGAEYFALFAELWKDNPPQAVDYPVIDRLSRLGVEPGKIFSYADSPPSVRAAVDAAPENGLRRIKKAFAGGGTVINGWNVALSAVGTYGADYAHRAAVAYGALGANTIEDAVYPLALMDPDGRPFDSGERYVVHFDKADLPPVRAFWSLTMYDERQLLAKNGIDRFAVGDRDRLAFNPDGSLDIHIQRDPPADEGKRANWLPAPGEGSFSLALRLYWPERGILDGEWLPPPVRKAQP